MNKLNKNIFPLGQTLMTAQVADVVSKRGDFTRFVIQSLIRHISGDWGELCRADMECNEQALAHKERIVSSYDFPTGLDIRGEVKIWIITEADRTSTTVLFPSEY